MNLIDFLEKNKITYKEKEYTQNIRLYKIGEKTPINMTVIYSLNNTFKIDRDLFYYLSNQKENYSFLLLNKVDGKMYYLEFKRKTNWLNSSFNNCDKDELYFGKIVLNYKIDEEMLTNKLKRY